MATIDISQSFSHASEESSEINDTEGPEDIIGEGESEFSESAGEDGAVLEVMKRKRKKPGKKSAWPNDITDDLVDVITSDEHLKRKLIFTNMKTTKNGELYSKAIRLVRDRCRARGQEFNFAIAQTRTKFKGCISECKKAALTCKTASGIRRFQEDKNYGNWFSQLLPLIKSRESCQPEQAVEPSVPEIVFENENLDRHPQSCHGSEETDEHNDSSSSNAYSGASSSNNRAKRPYVPIKVYSKKRKMEDVLQNASKALVDLAEQLKKDPVADLLTFFQKENENARAHELQLFSIMFGNQSQQNIVQQPHHREPQWHNAATQHCNQNMQEGPFPHQNFIQHQMFNNHHHPNINRTFLSQIVSVPQQNQDSQSSREDDNVYQNL